MNKPQTQDHQQHTVWFNAYHEYEGSFYFKDYKTKATAEAGARNTPGCLARFEHTFTEGEGLE